MVRNIIVIDDEESIQSSLKGALTDEGYEVSCASSGAEGISLVESEQPDLVLLDIWMEGMDGLETLKALKERYAELIVVMMSGHGNIETAVKATKLGAYDFVEKPLSLEKLLLILKNAFRQLDLSQENRALRKQVKDRPVHLAGKSKEIQDVRELIQQVAPTTGSVLITGENGTGKELVAQSIHRLSQRYNKPFIEVNCAAIPEELIESELFGHEKGAFTGATQLKRGKFDLANQGTIFLDEIGDMSLATQAKILRILQEQKFERVGGHETISVDVRIVAATNKDLRKEIQDGRFREDLFYRLNVIPFHLPPLRDRSEDIPILAQEFVSEFCGVHNKENRTLTADALRALEDYPWPGNVRELRNLMERIIILTTQRMEGTDIQAVEVLRHFKEEITGSIDLAEVSKADHFSTLKLKDARAEFEKEFILKTLRANEGNVSRTAEALGIERSHLHRKIKSYGIAI